MNDDCPPRIKLLNLVVAGEYVPHLDTCEECAAFIHAATDVVKAFADRGEAERAVAEHIDAMLWNTLPRHWSAVIAQSPELHRSLVVRDLIRRSDELYGTNSRLALSFTTAAVTTCEAMVVRGFPPSPDLHFSAMKKHALALNRAGDCQQALLILKETWPIAWRTSESQRDRAILSVCTAIVYAEPDIARFAEAIELAETATAVLKAYGDERGVLIARQTKGWVLMADRRFAEALPILRMVSLDLGYAAHDSRDAAIAYAQLAECLVNLGLHEEAIDHASEAERIQLSIDGVADAARAAHIRALAVAALGRFDEARPEFARTADILFAGQFFDTWIEFRLDFVAAALAADPGADVHADVELVLRVCQTLSAKESTQRQTFAAEAMDYLRQLAIRDALTLEAVDRVRIYIARNRSRPPVKFAWPSGGAFAM